MTSAHVGRSAAHEGSRLAAYAAAILCQPGRMRLQPTYIFPAHIRLLELISRRLFRYISRHDDDDDTPFAR